jgi:hypothetical protein
MRVATRRGPGKTFLLAACAAMAAAGCAATHTTTGPVTAASRTAASPTPQERAIAEAAAILRAFVVPPGGQRLPKVPDLLKVPSSTLVSTTLVDDVSFWRAPGQSLVHPAGPPSRRPGLEGPLERVASGMSACQHLAGHDSTCPCQMSVFADVTATLLQDLPLRLRRSRSAASTFGYASVRAS